MTIHFTFQQAQEEPALCAHRSGITQRHAQEGHANHMAEQEMYLGIDLTMLGVAQSHEHSDSPTEYANLAQLASCIHAAAGMGLDLACLGASFRSRSNHRHGYADGARTLASMRENADIGLVSALDAHNENAQVTAKEIAEITDPLPGWNLVEIVLSDSVDLPRLRELTGLLMDGGAHICVSGTCAQISRIEPAELLSCASWIRVKDTDAEHIIALRARLKDAGKKHKLDVNVLVDMGIVISGGRKSAHERALLIEAMNASELFPGILQEIGTVYDVADAAEKWIAQGMADGIIFVPASLPTDMASLLKGVLPLLQARAKVE